MINELTIYNVKEYCSHCGCEIGITKYGDEALQEHIELMERLRKSDSLRIYCIDCTDNIMKFEEEE